jgi:hypothetical protein
MEMWMSGFGLYAELLADTVEMIGEGANWLRKRKGLGCDARGFCIERNLFESSYATRLNRNMGLYFGLRW